MASSERTGLEVLKLPKDFQPAVADIFPSVSSLEWFIRNHRAELERQHAIVKMANRVYIDTRYFGEAAIEAARSEREPSCHA
jgi:hypothetical protein